MCLFGEALKSSSSMAATFIDASGTERWQSGVANRQTFENLIDSQAALNALAIK